MMLHHYESLGVDAIFDHILYHTYFNVYVVFSGRYTIIAYVQCIKLTDCVFHITNLEWPSGTSDGQCQFNSFIFGDIKQ